VRPTVQSNTSLLWNAVSLAGILATISAIVLSQYVSWTHVGADHVDGVQGRYFLPVLAFLPFVLPAIKTRSAATAAIAGAAQAAVAVCAATALVCLPSLVMSTYYE
jgi:uncharacterized membrane protein